jgi:hypothetical protein
MASPVLLVLPEGMPKALSQHWFIICQHHSSIDKSGSDTAQKSKI